MKTDLRLMLRSVAWMSASGYANATLQILRGLIFARILGPHFYGVWAFLATIQGLAMNADLGVSLVVARDMPGMLARGERQGADTLATLTRVWTPVACCVVGVVLGGMWPLLRWPMAPGWALLVPLLLLGMGSFNAATIVEKGSLAFRQLATLTTFAGLGALVGGVAAARIYGVSGLVASQALVYGGAGLIALVLRRSPIVVARVTRAWRHAVLDGWRLVVASLALQVFVSVDLLIAARALPTTSVGLYGVALMGSSMVGVVIASGVGTVVGQHLLREAAISDSGAPPAAIVWGPAAALALVLAPACALAGLLSPVVLRVLLPEYVLAAEPAAVLLAASYYLCSQFGFSTTFLAARRPLATLPIYLVLTAANVAIDILLLRRGMGLLGIAVGSLIVNVCFLLAHETLIWVRVSRGRRQLAQGVCSLAAGALPVAAAAEVLGYTAVALGLAVLGLVGWLCLTAVTMRWLGSRVKAERMRRWW